MDDRFRRVALLVAVFVTVLVGGRWLAQGQSFAGPIGSPDTTRVGAEVREAGLRFAPEVTEGDRGWILEAIARARPEAQRLAAEVDGMIEFRTHAGDPLGVTDSRVSARSASFTIDLDVASLDGRRVIDRDVVVLHELGHAIDLAIVPQETNDRLDAGIPRTGACAQAMDGLTGSCTEPAERFADTFAKWALRGRVSVVGAGYSVATPPSLEEWGGPLAVLAGEVAQR